MSILCPNTGRKPWNCRCPDCVAVRLGGDPGDGTTAPRMTKELRASIEKMSVFFSSSADELRDSRHVRGTMRNVCQELVANRADGDVMVGEVRLNARKDTFYVHLPAQDRWVRVGRTYAAARHAVRNFVTTEERPGGILAVGARQEAVHKAARQLIDLPIKLGEVVHSGLDAYYSVHIVDADVWMPIAECDVDYTPPRCEPVVNVLSTKFLERALSCEETMGKLRDSVAHSVCRTKEFTEVLETPEMRELGRQMREGEWPIEVEGLDPGNHKFGLMFERWCDGSINGHDVKLRREGDQLWIEAPKGRFRLA